MPGDSIGHLDRDICRGKGESMPPTIQQGSTGNAVGEAQYLLVRFLILDSIQVDGVFGPATKKAVKEFQQEEGLTVDGIVGPATWGAMLAVFSIPPTLHQGSTGPVVRRLQRVLNRGRSEYDPGGSVIAVDGVYGPHTKTAVEAFQKWGHVPQDGIVGLQTWAVSLHAAGQVLAGAVGV
jgi:peptidoglycan hydrolase-like protein with peptidoglycan-binding domain